MIYAPAVLAAVAAGAAQSEAAGCTPCAHITGGGIPGNLVRVLPPDCDARLDRRRLGGAADLRRDRPAGRRSTDDEMARVFNLGLGMVLVVDQHAGEAVLAALSGAGHDPVVVGAVVEGTGKVDLR